MNTRVFSAYNLARGVLLNSKLTVADSGNQPLKLLDIVVSGMGMDPTAGLWLTPLHAIPAVPRVFPFDLIYLDKEYRVLETAEMGPGIDFPVFHAHVASALILPSDTLRRTHTEPADRMIVCVSNELASLLAASAGVPPADSSAPNPEPALPPRSPSGRPASSAVLELTPERAPATVAAPVTAFEQSILTAVAKVAEARAPRDPQATSDAVPGPSMAITDAVLDSPHRVQPAIIEHHIDPEDLFSNWVVSRPPVPSSSRTGRNAPPTPPVTARSQISEQKAAAEPALRNGKKPADPNAMPPNRIESVRTPEKELQPPPVQPKSQGVFSAANKPVSSTEVETEPKSSTSTRANSAASHTTPTTTFTAVPYGMWQVSMPTAIAPMAGAKSPEPIKRANPIKTNGTSPAKSAIPASSKTAAPPSAATDPVIPQERSHPHSAHPSPAPLPETGAELAMSASRTDSPPATSKPLLRDQGIAEVHTPGDFVASLQEKLQRAQHFSPAAKLSAENVQESPVSVHRPELVEALPAPTKASSADPRSHIVTVQPKLAAEQILRSKQAPAPDKSKTKPSPGNLRSRFKQWLHPASSPSDRRRNTRRYVPGMVAHYFTGGAPKPHNIADISMTGMYLLTDDRWMPGTMIQMTLQKPCAQGEKKQSINVLSRIIRRGSDGVAAEFVMSEALSHISHDIQPSQATDRLALARFL